MLELFSGKNCNISSYKGYSCPTAWSAGRSQILYIILMGTMEEVQILTKEQIKNNAEKFKGIYCPINGGS